MLTAFCSDWEDITTHSVRKSLSERHSPLAGSPHNATHHPVGPCRFDAVICLAAENAEYSEFDDVVVAYLVEYSDR